MGFESILGEVGSWLRAGMPDRQPEAWLGAFAGASFVLLIIVCLFRRGRLRLVRRTVVLPPDVDEQFYSIMSDEADYEDLLQAWNAPESPRRRTSSYDAGVVSNGRFTGYADAIPVSVLEGKTMPNFSPEQRTGTRPPNGQHWPCTWSPADASQLKVRIGPNYEKHGKKAPSGPALYECIAADYVCADRRIDHVVPRVCPVPSGGPSTWHAGLRLPRALIINCQIPYQAGPKLWGTHPVEDGGVGVFPQFLVTSETCRVAELTTSLAEGDDALAQQEQSANAVKLLQRFTDRNGEMAIVSGSTSSCVVKVIGWVEDINALTLPATLKPIVYKFNGKPVLLSHAATCYYSPDKDVLELQFDVRNFTALARTMMAKLRYKLRECSCHVAFVLQGSADHELPEVVLCNLRLHNLALDDPYPFSGAPQP